MKAPRSASTGMVQQRTEQYLQRIAGVKDSNRGSNPSAATSPGEGTESEEEKLKKDANRSEKERSVLYLMNEGLRLFVGVLIDFLFVFRVGRK